jgi:hypothetical protein
MRMHVQGGIRRLVSFLEYSTHGHACKLSSMLERLLLDGVNRQATNRDEGNAARSQAPKS